jgi:hypothetical protein
MINEDQTVCCYKCYYKAEDEVQAKKDDKAARARGLIELPSGKWVKKKKAG